MKGTPLERFEAKYVPEPNTGCWLWTGCCTGAGYGQIRIARKSIFAHRFAYETLVGPIPDGLELDHLCRTPCCVNPAHLEPVTHRENSLRGRGGEWQRKRTHCPYGHEYSGDNLYILRSGSRACRTCALRRARGQQRTRPAGRRA